MDGLQSLDKAPRPIVATIHPQPISALPAKSPSDYIQALRRRIWMVLLVAVPVATAGTLLILRMTPVYSVSAQIVIEPPRIDPKVSGIVGHGELGAGDSARGEQYVPNALAILRSKTLAEDVLKDPSLELPHAPSEAEIADLMGKIQTRNPPKSQHFFVTLEGTDQGRLAKVLNLLLNKFRKKIEDENMEVSQNVEDFASRALNDYGSELVQIDKAIAKILAESTSLAPGGRNLREIDYERLRNLIFQEETRLGQLSENLELRALDPRNAGAPASDRARKVAELQQDRKLILKKYNHHNNIVRDKSDPALTRASGELRDIDEQIAQLEGLEAPDQGASVAAATEAFLARSYEKIEGLQNRMQGVMGELKGSMPEYQTYLTKLREREAKEKQIATMTAKISDFKMMARTQKPPVTIVDDASDPTQPIRPKKAIYIAGCIIFCLSLGVALVCFLEYIDNSVKVPEHLTAGLALPLFGVVPRIRREARNHRGGHLWTHGMPESIEADAFRNLRASLLGAGSKADPIITLLVTSAKAGEGKSTTALNLAATCARAGERVLLMDVDLRRPSLVDVFPQNEHGLGLVDVLRGDLPWQRTVVQSEIPNLDFLPTGDTQGVPIEVLGSLELRQLLLSLSQHHYDRVILDGPAVLGLADCRMLGRIVDASVLVVRSGSQGLRPLQRAKTMLEQSQVHIAGLIFNGLSDDLQNWSSYGTGVMEYPSLVDASRRPAGASRGLGASSTAGAEAALMVAGPVDA
ncbi:GumC family protein [Tundrisphaera sp. TA3]|uniref:GumC family protein n=1 Tax=Tundrisphaera sp. TA3 TaxID=3435775 RepID=UPI003EB822DC